MEQLSGDTILLPLDKERQERTDWFIRVRWWAGASILIGSGFLDLFFRIPQTARPLALVGVAVLLYNLILYLRRDRRVASLAGMQRSIHWQITLDWVALICTVYFTGGLGSPISLTFVFHLIIGAILLSRLACFLLAAGASFLLGALALLTGTGIVPQCGPFPWSQTATPLATLGIWVGLTIFFLVAAYLSTSVTARLRKKEEALSFSERALGSAYRELESLYELGQAVNSTLDINEILMLIAQNTTRLLHAKACSLRLFDKSGKKLYSGGWYGLSQSYMNKGPIEVEKSLVDFEALKGGVIQVLEVADDARFQYREEARHEGLRSMLSCPIVAKSRILGVIRVYTAEPHVFTEQEQKLLLSLANLGAVAIQNAHSYSDLQELDQERVWFARTTHHQLRAPLGAAQGAVEALSFAGPLNEIQQDLVERARRRIQDSCDMIRDLLDLAATQRIEDTGAAEPIGFEESLKRIIETSREHAKIKGLRFVEELEAGNCLVQIQVADLERIFSNLLNNAVKYTGGGSVIFGSHSADGWLNVWVADTGIGIESGEIEKVFKGFYRTAAAKATGEMGTGLGLSIVHHVLEKVGGRITVKSEPGKGTRIDVYLPLAHAQEKPKTKGVSDAD
jgi:signal transduction histidine kinase